MTTIPFQTWVRLRDMVGVQQGGRSVLIFSSMTEEEGKGGWREWVKEESSLKSDPQIINPPNNATRAELKSV